MRLKHLNTGDIIKLPDTTDILIYLGGKTFMNKFHQEVELTGDDHFWETTADEYFEFISEFLRNSPTYIDFLCKEFSKGEYRNYKTKLDLVRGFIEIHDRDKIVIAFKI